MSGFQLSRKPRVVLAVALIAALGASAATWQKMANGQAAGKETPAPVAVEHAKAMSTAFRKAAETMLPTVVTITSKTNAQTVKKGKSGTKRENPFKGTPLEDFFGRGGGDFDFDFDGQIPRHGGMGSGVIIDKSGIVLTNNHVVDGADEVTVHLADGREFKAEDIKTDDQTDLAVVRIKGAGTLPAAKLGDSDAMEIGDWVLAIGSPFELEQTVSAGIISGKGRELKSIQRPNRAKFLQTDAAINPGNSGGPLVNLDGEVVGINTAIATNNGSYQGVGFAIPINMVKWVVPQLLNKGSVERAYLGLQPGEIDRDLAGQLGVQPGSGVLVVDVLPNTPAAEAGFKVGDVITRFDGQKTRNPRDLIAVVERVPLNSKHKVELQRDGSTVTLEVMATALPKEVGMLRRQRAPQREQSDSAAFSSDKLGLEVADASADELKSLGYDGFTGVVISKVESDGVAAEQGLRRGMLIMKVGKKQVHNVEEFKAAVKDESLDDGILLLVRTQAGNRFVVLQKKA